MTLTPPGPDKDKPGRRTPPPAGDTQNITGQNVVGPITASGSARLTINQITYTRLSEVAEERERQVAELSALQEAIAQKYADLNRLVNTPASVPGNPYLFLQPFRIADHARFFGREDVLMEALEQLARDQVTFLNGNHGSGKTSLIRAGLVPALLEQGHLPLLINVANEPLETSIKKQLLPNLDGLQFLKNMALTEFISIVSGALPEGRMLFLLVDDFEFYFKPEEDAGSERAAEAERGAFYNEWRNCFNGAAPSAHWLFCVPSDLNHLLNFFKNEVWPNSHTVSVPPFSRDAARAAMTKPAEAPGIHMDEGVITSILDTLGGSNIDPADLQVVCYVLAGGKGALVKEWSMAYYTGQGGADGILRDYLVRSIEELEAPEREPAWQILALLAHPSGQAFTEQQLVEKMRLYGVKENTTHHVLAELQSRNLLDHAAGFKLSTESLRPRIEKWEEARSIRERARGEALEQWQSIRNSALRGLIGGAIGFVLADQLLYQGTLPDFSFWFFLIILDIAIGSLTGLMLVFSVDVSLASYSGPRKWMAYPTGALGGALAFAWAMVIYTNMNYLGEATFISLLPRAVLEGGLWGLVAGLGIVWTLESGRPFWITVPVSVLASGLILAIADSALGVLSNTPVITGSLWIVGSAGAILPGFILAAALAGRHRIRALGD